MVEMLIQRRDLLKQERERALLVQKEKEAELEQLRQTIQRIDGAIGAFDELIEDERQRAASPDT